MTTKALYHFNNSYNDSVGSFHLSEVGAPSFGSGKFSQGVTGFNPYESFLTRYPMTQSEFITLLGLSSDFTAELFVKMNNGDGVVFGVETNYGYVILINISGTSITCSYGGNYVGGYNIISLLGDNTFHHLAMVKNGSNVSLYLDGVSVISGTTSYSISSADQYAIQVGKGLTGSSVIDELRISDNAVYTTNFTAPTQEFTSQQGGPMANQIKKKFIEANAIDGTKLRLSNAEALRARNAAGSADIDVLQVDSSDAIIMASAPKVTATGSDSNSLQTKSQVDSAAGSAVAAHEAIASDAHDASAISFDDSIGIGATDVQSAIVALESSIDSYISSHVIQDDGSVAMAANLDLGSHKIVNVTDPTSAQDASTKNYVDAQDASTLASANSYADGKVADTITDGVTTIAPSQNAVFNALASKEDKTGTANFIRVDGTNSMGADLNLAGNKIMNVVDPTDAQHAATKNYVDTQDALKVSKAGDSMSGNLAMGGNQVIGLGAPVNANDAIRLVDLQNAQVGMDYQANVDGIQVDNTLVPVLTAGKRYIITNSASLHANFGSIAGLGDGDIVEYDGSAFVIMVDVSTKPAGSLILVGNRADDQQYEWKQSTGLWDIFYGFSANAAGIGLSLSGNVLNINLGAGIAELPSDEVGIDVHSAGALMLTVDNSASSTSNAAQLAVKLDGSTLAKSVDGLKVNQIADAQIASAAAIALNKLAALAPDSVVITDTNGYMTQSNVTATELGYVGGVTSGIQSQLDGKLALAGGTMSGAIDMGGNSISNLAAPSVNSDAATKQYVDNAVAAFNQSYVKESFTLSSTDISNGYVDLANEAVANSIVGFIGRLAIHQTEDFTVSVVSSVTRITFGALIGAGPEAPVEGDKLFFTYAI